MVIAWTISIVQKNFRCNSNMPGGIQLKFCDPYIFHKESVASNTIERPHSQYAYTGPAKC